MSIGDLIKKYRKSKNMNQEKLGNTVGVSRVTITRYENGTRTPDLETLVRIADALNIPTSYLLDNNVNSFSIDLLSNIQSALQNKKGHFYKDNLIDKLRDELSADFDQYSDIISDKSKNFPIDEQIILYKYLRELDTVTFLEFSKENISYIQSIDEMKKICNEVTDEFEDLFTEFIYPGLMLSNESENWTEEEMKEIEDFKEFLLAKRKNNNSKV